MPSNSFQIWTERRSAELDQMEEAHASVGGSKRGRRYATDQLNHAYAVLLASQFQGFCRDLHSESVGYLVACVAPDSMKKIVRAELLRSRKLDQGNAIPSTLGSDFNRLGINFLDQIKSLNPGHAARLKSLESLNDWRNAIAHQDFRPERLGAMKLGLAKVRQWRKVCGRLALAFDQVMRAYIGSVTGQAPWNS